MGTRHSPGAGSRRPFSAFLTYMPMLIGCLWFYRTHSSAEAKIKWKKRRRFFQPWEQGALQALVLATLFLPLNIYANTDLLPFDFYRRRPEAWHIQDVPALFFFFLAMNPICNYCYQVILKSSEASSRIREWTIVSDFRTCFIRTAKTNIKFTHCSHHLHPSCFLYSQGFREWLRPSPCQSTKCLHTRAHPALSFRWHPCLEVLQDKRF